MSKIFPEYSISNAINQLMLYLSNSNSEINRENYFDVYGGEIVDDGIFILPWW